MARILVTEEIAEPGLDRLRAAGHEVDCQIGLSPNELLGAIRGAHVLIIRSATQVTADVLAAGVGLMVVGRAGIGLDNVDVGAATRQGVMVVNAPQSNIVSTAEHTMAMLLAQARNIPQAHRDLVTGKWNRSKWTGVEIHDKTLAVVGLGRVGKLVAARAQAFGMRVIAHDPFVSEERAKVINVELVSLDDALARADFLTLHVVRTPETVGMIGEEQLAKAKPGLRLVNVSRGGVVDEAALVNALIEGRIGGAALDVFAREPMTDSPLFELDAVVVTPHLGASTHEAQDKAGSTIAEQVLLALANEFVPFAVNVEANEASEIVRPFLPLAEQLGALFASFVGSLPHELDVEFSGEIGGYDNQITTLAVLRGLLGRVVEEPVTYVNAMDLARDRGIEVRAITNATPKDYVNSITLRSADHSLSGTLVGLQGEPRLVMINDHSIDVPPADHMLVVNNADQPGMIGLVGSMLGESGVNIDDMDVGRSSAGVPAIMVLVTDRSVPEETRARLRSHDGILSVDGIDLR